MKYENPNNHDAVSNFWTWFSANSVRLSVDPANSDLIDQMEKHVKAAWPNLTWEIGPDKSGGMYLALSPGLDRSLVESAFSALQSAPFIDGWKFYASKPRKTWEPQFTVELKGRILKIDAGDWKYVLLRYPDGNIEILVVAPNCDSLTFEERWQVAAIVLEGMLGEEILLDDCIEFELEVSVDQTLSARLRPLIELPVAFKL